VKTTIPKLRQMVRRVISESMRDTVSQMQDIADIPRTASSRAAMDNLYKREREIQDQENRKYYSDLAAEENAAEKYFVSLTLPGKFNQHYAEWKSWLNSLDLSGAEFIEKQYHDSQKTKPFYFVFKIDKQKAIEIEEEGETLPETDYSSVRASVRKS